MKNTRNYIYVLILMVLAGLASISRASAKQMDDGKITVALVENEGFTVDSANPVVVSKGEPVSFDITIQDHYFYKETDGVSYQDGTLTFDGFSSDKNIYMNLGHNCLITVADVENGTVELLSEERLPDGSKSSVKIVADEHYEVASIEINGKVFPPIGGDVFQFQVEDDCEIKVNFIGEPVNFMYMSNNLGTITVGNQVDEYHYGDVINLDCVVPENINFNGWSVLGYLDDGGTLVGSNNKLEYTIKEDTILYANFKDTAIYHIIFKENQGNISESLDIESSPNVYVNLPVDSGKITRAGYTLIGYNTKADGSGEAYQLGEMMIMPKQDLELYAMWMKNTEDSYFDYTVSGENIVINGLKVKDENLKELCIPATINGKHVVAVGSNAFYNIDTLEKVIVPIGVKSIGQRALADCENLHTVYLPETLSEMASNAFQNTKNFSNFRVLPSLERAFDYDYDAVLADKYMKIKNATGKRIILVGGSNLTFGLNSVMLKERFPDYDIVNFSGSFMYGMYTPLELVKANAHEGDIVIFCPEYYGATYAITEPTYITNWQYIESNYAILEDIDIRNTPQLFAQYVTYLSRKREILPGKLKNTDSVYIRSGINSYGDLTVYRKNKTGANIVLPNLGLITPAGMNLYNSVCKELTEKGVTCLFSFPPVPGGVGARDYIDTMTVDFLKKLNESLDARYCTIISKCSDYSFDASLFYDDKYHLTLDGAKERTRALIKDLEEFGLD